MNIPDLITMLGNLSQSLYPLQNLISGGAYILGLLFFIEGIKKLQPSGGQSKEKALMPWMFILFGAGLIYLPSTMTTLANTAFGEGNVLTYTSYNKYNVLNSMRLVIQTAGLLWFVRGSVLVVHSSEPGSKDGPKGLVFMVSGIFAMNFDSTIGAINYIVGSIITAGISFKQSQGY